MCICTDHATTRQHTLTPHASDRLGASGLAKETIAKQQFRSVFDAAEVRRILGWATPDLGPCLEFRYFDLDGSDTGFVRLRPEKPRLRGKKDAKKPVKYEQPMGTPLRAYFPLAAREAILDPARPVIITEGELKALKATQDGFPCIGLPGVWAWKRAGVRLLIDDLRKKIIWDERKIFFVVDSDAATNDNVLGAAEAFRDVMREQYDADVSIIVLPAADGAKVGLDDYLVANGPEAFRRLLDAEKPSENQECPERPLTDYTPLKPLVAVRDILRNPPLMAYCPDRVAVIARSKERAGDGRKLIVPCKKLSCRYCFYRWAERQSRHFFGLVDEHLASEGAGLHFLVCVDGEWETVRKRLQRAGALYWAVKAGHKIVLVCTEPVKGSEPIEGDDAKKIIVGCIRDVEAGTNRPILASKPWRTPDAEELIGQSQIASGPAAPPKSDACVQCGGALDGGRRKYCCDSCRKQHHAEKRKAESKYEIVCLTTLGNGTLLEACKQQKIETRRGRWEEYDIDYLAMRIPETWSNEEFAAFIRATEPSVRINVAKKQRHFDASHPRRFGERPCKAFVLNQGLST